MAAVSRVEIDLVDGTGRLGGRLILSLLPRTTVIPTTAAPPPLLDLRGETTADQSLESVQLLEDCEYWYEVKPVSPADKVASDRQELLTSDPGRLTGRLRPGSHTGRLPLRFWADGEPMGEAAVEVRSRKIGYLDHYRWMLGDIASVMAEVVMERFAATEQRFEADHARDAATIYQRFAFLQSLISGENFQAAIHYILSRPNHAWERIEERRAPGGGVPANSAVARQMTRGTRRIAAPGHLSVESLPAEITVERHEETLDTLPNRFAKFALERWRDVVIAVEDAIIAIGGTTGGVIRGRKEASQLRDELDSILAQPIFREVGALGYFPGGNQVLQKAEGYRELFRAYVEFEVASKLAWEGGDEVYGAGLRDVATLYEYWVFFQLAEAVSTVCSVPFDLGTLIEIREDGLAIGLKRGKRRILLAEVERLGRRLNVELWFNRTFNFSPKIGSGRSWSLQMRPDYSVRISPVSPNLPNADEPDDVWLHFDAKYRLERVSEMLGDESAESTATAESREEEQLAARRGDLLKMHAYRDAIRRSAGAYVLYPGTDPKDLPQYHEVLPGLGAFALRPTASGEADGAVQLTRFLRDVMNHVASQLSQYERSRFWTARSFGDDTRVEESVAYAADFLPRPAADTVVLLGYVRSREQHRWIHEHRLYNLRADGRGSVGLRSRELAADVLVAYGPSLTRPDVWSIVGEPMIMTKARMEELGYPSPSKELYYCLQLEPVPDGPWRQYGFDHQVDRIAKRVGEGIRGAAITTTWLELMRES